MAAPGPPLHRFERIGWELWLAPAVAASVWGVLLTQTGGQLALARSVVFIGGPVVLLAGLLERLGSYLHAPQRLRLLPLPLAPALHFAAARVPHRFGMLASAGVGTVALGVAALAGGRPAGLGWTELALLGGDWLWLVALAAIMEPSIAATAAWFGRRFDPSSAPRRLQTQAGGGWTLPEAVVHLYAPALGIGTAALLAMPGQLTLDRIADQGVAAVSPGLWAAALSPVAVALALRAWAPRGYAMGMFEATAWLHQATRSLAGPPIPEDAPRWVRLLPDPALRLWALQLWRVTPIPSLRLWALLGVGAWIGWSGRLQLPAVAVLIAAVALWLVPAVRVAQLRRGRAAFLSAMPLPAAQRHGGTPGAFWILALPPVVAVGLAVVGAWVLGTEGAT